MTDDSEKPIRKMDAVLVRVPDGMKDRIMQRAKANGRSVNAELVAIISKAIGEPNEIENRALREEIARVEAHINATQDALRALLQRRDAVREELAQRAIEPRDQAE